MLLGARFQPAGEHASAWKYKRMLTVIIYDRQFEIAVEGCGRYWMPFHASERIRNRKSERDETASVKVGPPPTLHLERPLPTAFHNPDSSGDSRRYKTKHVSRTAAVTFITRLDQATSFNIGTNQTGGGGHHWKEFFDPIRRRVLVSWLPARRSPAEKKIRRAVAWRDDGGRRAVGIVDPKRFGQQSCSMHIRSPAQRLKPIGILMPFGLC